MLFRIRIWDGPTRLFHWLLVASVIGLIVTANISGAMDWHLRLGFFVLSLLLFRLLWGLMGGYWSRFWRFLYSPAALWAYVRGRAPAEHRAGHTPLGALSVFALLLVLAVQVSSGLLTDDEIFYAGPLVRLASHDLVVMASQYHKELGKFILLGLIALHLLALGFYTWVKRESLVSAMVTGDKFLVSAVPASADGSLVWLKALALYALSCAITYQIVMLGNPV